jgi:hypothetical protein
VPRVEEPIEIGAAATRQQLNAYLERGGKLPDRSECHLWDVTAFRSPDRGL